MVTLTERTIMKSRSGIYEDTSENRRKHRVGQKYGAEKQSDDGEKTEKKETDPAKELEAVNKVIAAINEGKLNLPNDQIMVLVEKKHKLEAKVKSDKKEDYSKFDVNVKGESEAELKKNWEALHEKLQKERESAIDSGNEESKKIIDSKIRELNENYADKRMKVTREKQEEKTSSKKYAEMDIKEAKKELLGKEITFKKYFFDGVDSYKDAVGKINQVRLYGKEKQPVLAADFPNGDSIQISLKQLDERKASKYEIVFDEKVSEEKTEKKEAEQKESTYEKADRVLKEAPIGAEASGGGYGPFKKEKVGVWVNKVTGRKFNGSLAEHIGGFSDFDIKGEKFEEKTEKKEEPLEGKEFFTVSESDVKNLKKEFDNVLNGVDLSKQNSDDIKETLRGIASDFLKKNYEEAENKAAKAGNRDFNLLNSQRDKASENIIFDYISNLNLNKRKVNLDEDKGSSTVKEKVQEEPKKEETTKEESKSEPKQGETEESYTRVKFDDLPNSGKVNLKKYLSDKVKRTADENLGILSKVSTENLKKMEAGLVKEFNSQFDDLPKSRRAEKLYAIMKVKGELASRGKETQKKE